MFLGPSEHIGCGYVMPEHFKSTNGRVKKPIISTKFQPIGQFVIDYLVIKAIQENEENPPKLPQFSLNNGDESKTISNNTTSVNKSIIKSNKKFANCNFKVTYAKHWKSHWKGLEVAHRGLGNSYTKAQK